MKAMRVLGFVFLIFVAFYLLWLHSTNSILVSLPGFISVSPAIVIAGALTLGWFAAWLPARLTLWRKDRELGKLTRRIQELEQHLPSYDRRGVEDAEGEAEPVIPDRSRNLPNDTDL